MNLDVIRKTYCLNGESFLGYERLRGIKLQSPFSPHLTFIGVGRHFSDAKENCVEVFLLHQYFHREGMLKTKNLN